VIAQPHEIGERHAAIAEGVQIANVLRPDSVIPRANELVRCQTFQAERPEFADVSRVDAVIVLAHQRVDAAKVITGSGQLSYVGAIDAVVARIHELLQRRALILVRRELVDEREACIVPRHLHLLETRGFSKAALREFGRERLAWHELHCPAARTTANDAVEFEDAGVAPQTKTRRPGVFSSDFSPSKSSTAIVALCDECAWSLNASDTPWPSSVVCNCQAAGGA
jgi:hypothetical protein